MYEYGMNFNKSISRQTMNLDVTRGLPHQRDVVSLATDLFLIVIRMREFDDLGDPAALKKLIVGYIDLFLKNCRSSSLPSVSIGEALYALVAFIDETVLSIPGACRDLWIATPLQLDYFGDLLAGSRFYEKLLELQKQPDAAYDVLMVYYLCLSLGFEGKYKLGDIHQRLQLIDNLGKALRNRRPRKERAISPHAAPDTAVAGKTKHHFFAPWLLAAGSAVFAVLWWFVLLCLNGNSMKQLLLSLQTLFGQ